MALNSDCGELVEAGKRLSAGTAAAGVFSGRSAVKASTNTRTVPASPAPSSTPSSSTASYRVTPSAALASYAASMAADTATLSALADAAQQHAEAAAAPSSAAALSLSQLANHIMGCAAAAAASPHVFVSGLGKSGAVAGRLAASLRSLGIRANFIHGAEWSHGDVGVAAPGDLLLLISHSGRTGELVDAAVCLAARGVGVASITGDADSPLARASTVGHLLARATGELLGAVPTRSIVAQEAVANGLLTVVADGMGVTLAAFRLNHPGGAIGKK